MSENKLGYNHGSEVDIQGEEVREVKNAEHS
jgi:hypothetical protein